MLAVEYIIVDSRKGANSAIATLIWTGMFGRKLTTYLAPEEHENVAKIYKSLGSVIDPTSSVEDGSLASGEERFGSKSRNDSFHISTVKVPSPFPESPLILL